MDLDLKIFLEAPDPASPEELARYLDWACAEDMDLRSRVEALFEADGVEQGLVDQLPISSRSSAPSEGEGHIIDNYKLLQKIGEGGFGEVYMAEQSRPVKRRVALKIIKPGMDTRQVVARFEAERQALAMMDHPHIAKVFDAGSTGTGRPYFVMELVRGIPITKFCDDGKLSLEQRTKLFMKVCQAVQHAHQKGIIHRDLKPSNILVTIDGDQPVPKVIDFGIAKATQASLTEKTLFTRFEMFIGTPAYMSPEQANLNEFDIDTRSDIYALGVLLYELFTGATPFDQAGLIRAGYDEIRRKIREEEPPAVSKRVHTMSAEDVTDLAARLQTDPSQLKTVMKNDLDWIVMKAMEKQRARRYESATAFADDLQRFLDREPVLARPPSHSYRLAKFVGKHRTAMGLASVFLILLVLGVTGVIWQWRQAVANALIAEKQTEVASERTRETKEALQESRTNEGRFWLERAKLYANEPGSGFAASLMAARAIGFTGFGREKQDREFQAEFPNLLEGSGNLINEARELIRSHERAPRPLWSTPATLGHEKRIVAISHSPDGELIASADADGVIIVWEADSSKRLVTLSEHLGEVTALAFSPDGRTLASAGYDQSVTLWRRDQDWEALRLIGHSAVVRGVAFPEDGRFVASAGGDGKIKLWDPISGRLLRTLEDPEEPQEGASVFSLAADGKRAAYSTGTAIKLLDLESGAVRTLPGSGPGVISLSISPNGKWLASGARKKPGRIWNLEDETLVTELDHPTPENFNRTAHGMRFSPDGKRLAHGQGYRVVVWEMTESGTPKDPRILSGHHNFVATLAWAPNGTSLVSGGFDRRLIQWNLEQPSPTSIDPGGHVDLLKAVARSPDGRWVATAGNDLTIRIWEMATGRLFQTLTGHREGVSDLAFHPDGRRLASASYSDQEVILWDLDSGSRMLPLPRTGPSYGGVCVAFSPDGSYLVGAGRNGKINIWDLERKEHLGTIPAQSQPIYRLAFSPDSRFLASASQDTTVHLWAIDRMDELDGAADWILRGHGNSVTYLDFSLDGRWLASSGGDGKVRLWDYRAIAQGSPVRETGIIGTSPDPNLRYPVTAVFSPDSRHLAIGDWTGRVAIWDPESQELEQAFQCHDHEVSMLAFGPDGKSLITASRDHTATCWELGGPVQDLFKSRDGVESLTLTSEGSQWVAGHDQGTVTVWDAQRGVLGQEFQGHEGRVLSVALSPDDRIIASAGDDGKIMLRERESGRLIQTLNRHDRAVLSISFSNDGKILASAGKDGRILLWDLERYQLLREISHQEHWVRCVDLSPDGTMLAGTKNSRYAAVWKVASGEELVTLPLHEDLVTSVAFSPDGSRLGTSCSEGGRMRLWEVDEFRTGGAPAPSLTSLSRIGGSLLAFDAQGKRLVNGGWQPSLGVWELEEIGRRNQPLTFSASVSSEVTGLTFTPTDNSIITAGKDGTISRWSLERPSEDLASYLAEDWYVIYGRKIFQSQQAISFDRARNFGYIKSLPSTHIGILQRTKMARLTTERLFDAYLRARNVTGAVAIWTQLENARFRDQAFRDLATWLIQSKQTTSVAPEVLTWQLNELEKLAKKAGHEEWQQIILTTRTALNAEESKVVPPLGIPSLTGRWLNNNGGIKLHFDQQGGEVLVRAVLSNRYWTGKIEGDRITLTANSFGSKYMEGTFTGKLTHRFTGIEWDTHEDHWRLIREE